MGGGVGRPAAGGWRLASGDGARCAPRLSLTVTATPLLASCTARSRPIPEADPVIKAARPSISGVGCESCLPRRRNPNCVKVEMGGKSSNWWKLEFSRRVNGDPSLPAVVLTRQRRRRRHCALGTTPQSLALTASSSRHRAVCTIPGRCFGGLATLAGC